MKHEKSCGAVVYKKENDQIYYLLIKHKNGNHWDFPKGHVEEGETEIQTALREVLEETGLTITLNNNFKEALSYHPAKNIEKEVIFFLGESKGEMVKLQEEEIGEAIWLTLQEAEQKLTFQTAKELLIKANKVLSEASL